MPKIMNSSIFLDPNAHLIDSLYIARLNCEPEELSFPLTQEQLHALTELKFYKLPLYFRVPLHIKARLRPLLEERDLLNWEGPVSRIPINCDRCRKPKPLGDGLCADCKVAIILEESSDIGDAEMYRLSTVYEWITPHIGTFRSVHKLKSLFLEDSVKKYQPQLEHLDWPAPKALLLANVLGCTLCSKVSDAHIWGTEEFDWEDGLCAECFPSTLSRDGYWNQRIPRYDRCTVCYEKDFDYKIRGMCELCYQNWQDSYLELPKLLDFISKYGALASLLIRGDIAWIQHLSTILPKRNRDPRKAGIYEVFIPRKPLRGKVRLLKDAGLDLNTILLSGRSKDEISNNK